MRRIISCLFLYAIIIWHFCLIPAHAISAGIIMEPLSEDEKASFIEALHLELITNDDRKPGIQCFDVNRDGTVAIATGSGNQCTIYVYDSQGTFQYGYRFRCDGDYGVTFYEDMLSVFFLRGDTFAFFNSTGQCVDVQKVMNRQQNHDYIKGILNRTFKETSGKMYSLERDIELGETYSRLVVTDADGDSVLLYDVGHRHGIAQIIELILIILFVAFGIKGCLKKRSFRC